MDKRKILFLTGTRADFGKLKPLIKIIDSLPDYESHIFATGMHMLERHGATVHEILKEGFEKVYMYNNVAFSTNMDICLASTILGLTGYIKELEPDMIVVHGDRPEALAGAIVGSFNNIRVTHVEGGELSGTIDELIRHSITKLSHIHLVTNKEAQKRLIQMGEREESIFIIGSPEIDIMLSNSLPLLDDVRNRYGIPFETYAILIYHPVTTELNTLNRKIKVLVSAVIESNLNYIVICSNNDHGFKIIAEEYKRFEQLPQIKMFTSLRFEYFLALLKHAKFIIGNSSSGVREMPVYGLPSINIGTRQQNRNRYKSILDVREDKKSISNAIAKIVEGQSQFESQCQFGKGNSAEIFKDLLQTPKFWRLPIQKIFKVIDKH